MSPNARIAPGATGSVDVSVRRRDGQLVAVEPVGGAPLSTDASLVVRIGSVDLSDGLQHFGDMDSVAGTLEERTLLKAHPDGDPGIIDVVVEGVSLSVTQKQEYASVIQNNGGQIDGLLQVMRDQLKTPTPGKG